MATKDGAKGATASSKTAPEVEDGVVHMSKDEAHLASLGYKQVGTGE